MMNDISALERQFDEMVQEQVLDAGVHMMRVAVTETFNMIVDTTTVWSGYAAANQRIGVGGLEDAELDPPMRSELPPAGEFVHLIEPSRARELAKLADIEFGEPVEVGTSVGYFPDIGWTENRGVDIYTEASIAAPQIAQGLFDQG